MAKSAVQTRAICMLAQMGSQLYDLVLSTTVVPGEECWHVWEANITYKSPW